jgi:hypothetical protein
MESLDESMDSSLPLLVAVFPETAAVLLSLKEFDVICRRFCASFQEDPMLEGKPSELVVEDADPTCNATVAAGLIRFTGGVDLPVSLRSERIVLRSEATLLCDALPLRRVSDDMLLWSSSSSKIADKADFFRK